MRRQYFGRNTGARVKQAKDYRDSAEECRSVAANMKNEDLRARVLELAQQWDRLAEDREKITGIRASLGND